MNVRYWGVGNESWGCGGNFDPEDYAIEFKRYTTWVPSYGVPLRLVASGPNSDEQAWTRGFFNKLYHGQPSQRSARRVGLERASLRNQSLSRQDTRTGMRRRATRSSSTPSTGTSCARETDRMESIILDHWTALGEFDLDHNVKLVVDEYGPWYRPGTENAPEQLLGQMITVRDAVMTAISLDTFNRNADKVGMAACAQLVNNLNALFLTPWRQVHGDAELQRLRDVRGAPGRNGGARRVFIAGGALRPRRQAGQLLGTEGFGLAEGQDPDADRGEPRREPAARDGDCSARRHGCKRKGLGGDETATSMRITPSTILTALRHALPKSRSTPTPSASPSRLPRWSRSKWHWRSLLSLTHEGPEQLLRAFVR